MQTFKEVSMLTNEHISVIVKTYILNKERLFRLSTSLGIQTTIVENTLSQEPSIEEATGKLLVDFRNVLADKCEVKRKVVHALNEMGFLCEF